MLGPVKCFESIPEVVKHTGVSIPNNAGIHEGKIFEISFFWEKYVWLF